MAVAENSGVVCKCSPRRSFRVRFRQHNLRNISSIPLFKHALFTCSPLVAGKTSILLSMSAHEKSRPSLFSSSRHKRIPIYVMMPVDAFCIDGSGIPRIRRPKALTVSLKALKLAGGHGVAVEVWWYPAHFGDGKRKFPGIREFRCYEHCMLDNLKMAACEEGKPQWGERGPPNTGCYNSMPSEVPFFEEGEESFLSDYGCFFLV